MATVPPEDTSYGIAIRRTAKRIEERSKGRLKIKHYAGAVLGDEPPVAKMVQDGEIEAGGLTGLGLGKISPEIRILELPLLFETYQEQDYIMQRYFAHFADGMEKQGVKLLSLISYGRINLWSNVPIHTIEDALSMKLWLWKGDVLAEAITASLGGRKENVVPLEITEVPAALHDGRVNLIYNFAAGLIILGWYPYVTHVITDTLSRAVSGFVVNLKAWNSFPADLQEICRDELRNTMETLGTWISRDDRTAYIALVKRGIQGTEMNEKEKEKFRTKMREVRFSLVGKLYSRELLDSILADLESFRAAERQKDAAPGKY
ncbi:MAG: TRAP transporter substrate-binding protein DctP [Nitrospirae bacterium]|nr:TRAP transporter substrate-binding protein DctP [Nitrospirota bacterium]